MSYYDQPNYTMVPNKLLDFDMAQLSRCELTSLLYIVRHTLGFGKTMDAISYKQFLHGITRQDGVTIDRGTGIKNRTALAEALASLERRGCIEREYPFADVGDRDKTVYRLSVERDGPQQNALRVVGGSTENVLPSTESVLPSTANRTTGSTESVLRGSTESVPGVVRLAVPTKERYQKKTEQKKTDNVCGADEPRRAREHHQMVCTDDDPDASTERRLALKLAGDVLACKSASEKRLASYERLCADLLAQGYSCGEVGRWMDWMNSGACYWHGKARMWSEERMLDDLADWDSRGRPARKDEHDE